MNSNSQKKLNAKKKLKQYVEDKKMEKLDQLLKESRDRKVKLKLAEALRERKLKELGLD